VLLFTCKSAKHQQNILKALKVNNVEKFTEYVAEYDNILKLDNWKCNRLLDIKKIMQKRATNVNAAPFVS